MIGLAIEDLSVGDRAEATRAVTTEAVREFVAATGDDNPMHSDATFAAATRFGRVIAPGMLTGCLVSAVIGTRLPGPGTIYLSQSFRFVRPVHIGDTLTARVEVSEIVPERNRVCLRTSCVNGQGDTVLEGEAWVLPPRVRVEYDEDAARARAIGALAWAPAGFAAQLAAWWVASGLALASHAAALCRPRV
jgi:acyl dehydratase